jgi:hypothetical protein
MSALLAGLTVLVIGDSHLATPGYLISTLHDDLMNKGAVVYSYGACGVPSGAWLTKTTSPCGGAQRLADGQVEQDTAEAAATRPLGDLIKAHNPNLIVVVNGDTMAAYTKPVLPKTWVWQQVSALTKDIKKTGISCVWVGPAWGTEGGQYGKNFARVKEMSGYLSEIVAPCTYVDSLTLSKPGEWRTFDGQHFTSSGYRNWGGAIGNAIAVPEVLNAIKK